MYRDLLYVYIYCISHCYHPSPSSSCSCDAVRYGALSTQDIIFQHSYLAARATGRVEAERREGGREREAGREEGWGVRKEDAGCVLARALPLTTSTPTFRGSIDHIWHSEGLEVAATLSLPYHAEGHEFRYMFFFSRLSFLFQKKRGNSCSGALSLKRARVSPWLQEALRTDAQRIFYFYFLGLQGHTK